MLRWKARPASCPLWRFGFALWQLAVLGTCFRFGNRRSGFRLFAAHQPLQLSIAAMRRRRRFPRGLCRSTASLTTDMNGDGDLLQQLLKLLEQFPVRQSSVGVTEELNFPLQRLGNIYVVNSVTSSKWPSGKSGKVSLVISRSSILLARATGSYSPDLCPASELEPAYLRRHAGANDVPAVWLTHLENTRPTQPVVYNCSRSGAADRKCGLLVTRTGSPSSSPSSDSILSRLSLVVARTSTHRHLV